MDQTQPVSSSNQANTKEITEDTSVDYNSIVYLKQVKESSKIQTRLNYLESYLTEMLARETQLYSKLSEAEGKNRWKVESEERINIIHFKYQLTAQPDTTTQEGFIPVEPIINDLQRCKNEIIAIEQEQNELREKLKKTIPNIRPPIRSKSRPSQKK